MIDRLFIFGAGFSARAFARTLAPGTDVLGTTRSADKTARLKRAGIRPLLFSGESVSEPVADALAGTTHLLVSAAPGEAGDPVLHAAAAAIAGRMPKLAWIGYLSTVGVYGDHGGAWVDEETPCRPASRRSTARLAAEDAWLALGRERGVPVAVLRLAGIYGPGRNAFVNLERGTARRVVKPGQVFNRTHVDDIAGGLSHLIAGGHGGLYNLADDEPSPPQDVVAHAAGLMGIEPPPEIAFEEAEMGPMARSFYGECKRVSNARIKALGYRFARPTYRDALAAMWRAGTWRSED